MGKHLQVRGPQTPNNLVQFNANGFAEDSGISIDNVGDGGSTNTPTELPPQDIEHATAGPITIDLNQSRNFYINVLAGITDFDVLNLARGIEFTIYFRITPPLRAIRFVPGKFRFQGGNAPQFTPIDILGITETVDIFTGVVDSFDGTLRASIIVAPDWRAN